MTWRNSIGQTDVVSRVIGGDMSDRALFNRPRITIAKGERRRRSKRRGLSLWRSRTSLARSPGDLLSLPPHNGREEVDGAARLDADCVPFLPDLGVGSGSLFFHAFSY